MGRVRPTRPNRYSPHRHALAPLLPGAPENALPSSCAYAAATGEDDFTTFLISQGLAPLWGEQIHRFEGSLPLSQQTRDRLHQSHLGTTGIYLLQRHNLQLAGEILNEANIPHAVIKGSHTRELYYDTPALRPAVDIDILVKPGDSLSAIKAFQRQGFEFNALAQNISHECNLVKGKTAIDLHWDIMRPGRTREPMTNALLDNRVNYSSHCGLDHAGTLFLMLVHPVFAKYSTTPHAALVRLVDLAQLLHRFPESTEATVPLLQRAGLATAGWITLTWLDLLTDNPRARSLAGKLEPGRLRRYYLRSWLARDLSTRLLGSPLLIQLGFTLPAHDRFSDAVSALLQARRYRQAADTTLAATQEQLVSTS